MGNVLNNKKNISLLEGKCGSIPLSQMTAFVDEMMLTCGYIRFATEQNLSSCILPKTTLAMVFWLVRNKLEDETILHTLQMTQSLKQMFRGSAYLVARH